MLDATCKPLLPLLVLALVLCCFACGARGNASRGQEFADDDSSANPPADDDDNDNDNDNDDDNDDDNNDDDTAFHHILPRSNPPAHLYVLDIGGLAPEITYLAASLQGLVARMAPEIYLTHVWPECPECTFLDFYASQYGITSEPAADVWALVDRFQDRFAGAVVYDPNLPETLDVATTIAGLENLVILHPDLLAEAQTHGVAVVEDLRGRWTDKFAAFDWEVANLLPQCTTVAVADLDPTLLGARDYLIENRIFTFRYKAIAGEAARLAAILELFPQNIPVLGYLAANGSEEAAGEDVLSAAGKFLLASDFAPNLSVHSGIDVAPAAYVQPPDPPPDLTPQQIGDSVFVAFAFSDGDNYSIPLRTLLQEWSDPARGQVPLSWTIPGASPTLIAGVADYYYQNRSPLDRFMTMCGVGYNYPTLYPDRPAFADLSAAYARYLDLDAIWWLDPLLDVQLPDPLETFLDRLAGEDSRLRGYASGYSNGRKTHDFTTNGTPLLYNVNSYDDDPTTAIADAINAAKAGKQPGAPAYLFFGMSIWTVTPSDIAAGLAAFQDDETVRPLLLSQMFDLMRVYAPGW